MGSVSTKLLRKENPAKAVILHFTFTACLMDRFPLLVLERAAGGSSGNTRVQIKDIFSNLIHYVGQDE